MHIKKQWDKVITKLGEVYFSYTAQGLYSLSFPPGNTPLELQQGKFLPEPHWLNSFYVELQSYLHGGKHDFNNFPVDFEGWSPFFREALRKARFIPYGEVVSYAMLASAAGNPRASRAAGSAMARNRLPLVIPCHRVIKSNGDLGRFGPGVSWKKFLLDLEGVPSLNSSDLKKFKLNLS